MRGRSQRLHSSDLEAVGAALVARTGGCKAAELRSFRKVFSFESTDSMVASEIRLRWRRVNPEAVKGEDLALKIFEAFEAKDEKEDREDILHGARAEAECVEVARGQGREKPC